MLQVLLPIYSFSILKFMFETNATINCSRCVDILIIFSSSIITEEQIINMINIHSTLLFI